MDEKKYKVAWQNEIIARDMRIDDALLFIGALCEKYYNNKIEIKLLDNGISEES